MIRYTLYIIISSLMVAMACVSCSPDDDLPVPFVPPETAPDTARCAVLVYMAAENSLSTYASSDISEMIAGASGIPSDGRLIVYIDDRRGNPRIYEVSPSLRDTVCLYRFPSAVCSAEGAAVAEVLQLMKDLAPAKEYGLVLWSHGSGWLPGTQAFHTRSILEDTNIRNGWVTCRLSVETLATVLADVLHPHYIFFDACLMQSAEVAYALRDATDYIVASPAEIPAHGAAYDRIMPYLFGTQGAPVWLANEYRRTEEETLRDYNRERGGGVVLSIVKTSEMEAFAQATRRLVKDAVVGTNGAQRYWDFSENEAHVRSRNFPDFLDIKEVMRQFSSSPDYEGWTAQLDRTVVHFTATDCWDSICDALHYWSSRYGWGYQGLIANMQSICGMSVFVPQDKYLQYKCTWNDDIRATEWWQAVHGD